MDWAQLVFVSIIYGFGVFMGFRSPYSNPLVAAFSGFACFALGAVIGKLLMSALL